jgi:adenine phosphoribosyltransferase
MLYKDYITEVPDFPIEGVSFKDISPLLANQEVFEECIDEMGMLVDMPDYWIGIDARGFIFASALSMIHGGGVVMCRKAGKLPPPTARHEYKTEYSEDVLEMKIGTGSVVVVDDVLATGGTLQAVNDLCQTAGYTVIDNLVLIDLLYVTRIKDFNLKIRSLIQYE